MQIKTAFRALLFATSTFAIGCGAHSGAPAAGDDDDGTDAGMTGSDAGSDDPNAMLTVSDAGFVTIDPVRWAPIATPTVSGTVTDPHATVDVRIAGASIGMATVADTAWTFTMPASALGVVPTDVTFVARVGAGMESSITRKLAVDVTPPVLVAQPTTVQNELNDQVTFGPDGTILSHAHVDAGKITLGAATACPDVFKHAYLMDPGDGNPIHWELRATDDGIGLDPTTATVRIGRKDGTLFGPVRPIAGTGTSDTVDFALDAVRSGPTGDAFLGTTEAQMVIQLTAKDRFGRAVTLERCWTHHPLAVPLLATAGVPSTGELALPANRLEAGSFTGLTTEMINPGSGGLSMLDYELFNGTDEHALVTFTVARPALTTRRDYVRQSAVIQFHNLTIGTRKLCHDIDPDPACDPPAHPPRVGNTGSVLTESPARFVVRVVPINANGSFGTELACTVCDAAAGVFTFDLAGKPAITDPGVHYHVMTGIREVTNLFPSGAAGDPDSGPYLEALIGPVLNTTSIAGKLIASPYSGCTHTVAVQIGQGDEFNTFCDQTADFRHYRALTKIDINLGGALRNQPASAPAAGTTARALGSLGGPRVLNAFSYSSIETLPPAF